ncbi:unnamed protein product [Closterium sp. Yama58-4]|nr:unnamed protein product [Closterium sp. Yama58-4]
MDASVPHTQVQEHASTAAEALMELGFRSTSSEEIDDDSERTVERAVAEPGSGNGGDERADQRANEADGTPTAEPTAGGGTEAVTPRPTDQDEKQHGQDEIKGRSTAYVADESQEGEEAVVLQEGGGERERKEFDARQGDVEWQASNGTGEAGADGANNQERDKKGGNDEAGDEENFGDVAGYGEKERGAKAPSPPEKISPVRGHAESRARGAQEHLVATRSSNSPLTPAGAQTPQTAEVKSVQTPATQPPQHAQSGLATVPGVPIQPALPLHGKPITPTLESFGSEPSRFSLLALAFRLSKTISVAYRKSSLWLIPSSCLLLLCVFPHARFVRAFPLPAPDGALVSLVPAASEDGQIQWIQPPQFMAAPQFMGGAQFVGGAQLMGGAQLVGPPGHGVGMMPAGPVSFFRTSSFAAPVSATGMEGTFMGTDGVNGVNATARGVSGDLFGGNAGDEVIEGSWDDLIICTPTGGFPGGFHGQMGWGGERTSRAGRRTQLWEGDPQLVYRLQQSYHTDDSAAADTKPDPSTIAITGTENASIRNDSIRGDGGEEEALPAESRGNQEASTPPGMGPESRDVPQSTATMSYREAMASGQLPLHVKVEFPTPSPRGGVPSPSRGGMASPSRGGLGFSYHSPIPLCSPSPLRLCAMELGDMAEPNLWLSPPASTKYTLDKLGDFPPFSPRLPAIVRGYSAAALPYLDPSAHQQPSRMSPSKGEPPGFAPPGSAPLGSAPPQAPGGPTADSAENPPVSASAMGSAAPQSGSPRAARRGTAEGEGDAAREDIQAARREDEAVDSAGARRESGAAGTARLVSSGSPGSGVRYSGMRGRSLLQQCLIMGAEQRATRAVTGAGAGGNAAAGAGGNAAAVVGSRFASAGGNADPDIEGEEKNEQAENAEKNDKNEDETGERSGGDADDRAAGSSPSVLRWRAVGCDGRRLGDRCDVRSEQERTALGAADSNAPHASTPPLSPPPEAPIDFATAAGSGGVRAGGEGETNVGGGRGKDFPGTEMRGQESRRHVAGAPGEVFRRESDFADRGESLSRADVTTGGRSFVVGSLGSTLTERVSVLELENKQTTRAGNSEDGATETANFDASNSSGNSRSSSNLDSGGAESNDEGTGEDGSGVVEKEEGAREEDGGESRLSGRAATTNSAKHGADEHNANLGDRGDGENRVVLQTERVGLTAEDGTQAVGTPADGQPSRLPVGAERRRAERKGAEGEGAERKGAEVRCGESSPGKASPGLVRPQPRRARSGDHAISPSFSIPASPFFESPRLAALEGNAPQSAGEERASAQAPLLQPVANVRQVQAAAQSHSGKHQEHGEAGGPVFESTSQLSGGSEGGGRGAREESATSDEVRAKLSGSQRLPGSRGVQGMHGQQGVGPGAHFLPASSAAAATGGGAVGGGAGATSASSGGASGGGERVAGGEGERAEGGRGEGGRAGKVSRGARTPSPQTSASASLRPSPVQPPPPPVYSPAVASWVPFALPPAASAGSAAPEVGKLPIYPVKPGALKAHDTVPAGGQWGPRSSQPTAASGVIAPTESVSGVQVTPPGAVQSGAAGVVQGGGAVQSGAPGAVQLYFTLPPLLPFSFDFTSPSRLTKRWEASLWTNKKQLYLGGYDAEEKAARAYDIAALACKGAEAITNFPRESYADSIGEYLGISCEALIAKLRRESSAFSRGRSKFRGVSGQEGRWEARIGSYFGRRNVSLGVYETEEAAAEQYDRALIIQKGTRAKTNFCISKYIAEHLQHEQGQEGALFPSQQPQSSGSRACLPTTAAEFNLAAAPPPPSSAYPLSAAVAAAAAAAAGGGSATADGHGGVRFGGVKKGRITPGFDALYRRAMAEIVASSALPCPVDDPEGRPAVEE